ncbi:MAG: LamG-like jellyroll fold domain-containing protein, partial [Candidatus Omnitrophota bacterium]|nr:LamG-like jellyroll fold domain-containing protein [Candidatus Omnitrophota bacterium]
MTDKTHNLFFKLCSIAAIVLHLITFGPLREALAFSASSASYNLTSAVLTQGGKARQLSYTKLLLHYDGPDGFQSGLNPAIEARGDVRIDTTQSKFGGSSAFFDGNESYLSLPDSDDWSFGTEDFTIECWVKWNVVGSTDLIGQKIDNYNKWVFYYENASPHLSFYGRTSSGVFLSLYGVNNSFTPVADTWYHLAAVRKGNNIYLFADGVMVSSGTMTLDTFGDLSASLQVGQTDGYYHNGWIDEVRVSKGVARWTANFTPPDAPYNFNEDDAAITVKLYQDAIAEPIADKSTSDSYILNSGFIPALQTNPPVLTQEIPAYQTWVINDSKNNFLDLDDYFSSPEGYPLTYSVTGNSNIKVTIDPSTHMVIISQPAGWFGVEKIYFTATDTDGNTTQTDEITLQVANAGGLPNKPVIVDTQLSPLPLKEGSQIKLTVKAYDLDNQDLTFSYSGDLFKEIKCDKVDGYWISEATWDAPANSKGHYNIEVTVSDGALTDVQPVLLNIGNFNHLPVLDPIPDVTVEENQLAVISATATDQDNDPIIFYYSAPFDSQGKWLTDFEDEGSYSVLVTASDGIDFVSRQARVTIKKKNRPPEVNLALGKYTAAPDELIPITELSATDPDGDSLTVELRKDGELIPPETSSVSFSGLGSHTLLLTAVDSGGLRAEASKDVHIAKVRNASPLLGDFDGNSLTDLGLFDADTGTWEICLSQKGVFEAAREWSSGFGASREVTPVGGDFNGDAKSDIGIYNYTTQEVQIRLSTGSNFSGGSRSFSFPNVSNTWQPLTGNFNGDKFTDFALYSKESAEIRIALGNANGFDQPVSWLAANDSNKDYLAMGGDFNADSLTDLLLFKKSSGEVKLYFSNTTAFVESSLRTFNFSQGKDLFISEFNHDGLADLGYWDKDGSRNIYYAIFSGDKFTDKTNTGAWLNNFGSTSDESVTTADFDGNGVLDAAAFDKKKVGILCWTIPPLQDKKLPDLLTEAANGIGGLTQISYTYAAKSKNTGLPFPVYVASSISSINTLPADRAAAYTQNFDFSEGYFDAAEREFRGFAKVIVTDPVTNNYSETYFYQGKSTGETPEEKDPALRGQIKQIISYDGNLRSDVGRKISEVHNTYQVKKEGTEANFLGFPALSEQVTTIYEENGTSLATKDSFTYDNIGNLLEAANFGDIAKTGDEKTKKTSLTNYAPSYTYSATDRIGFNRPIETALRDKDDKVISKKSFEYDARGNLTKDTVFIYNPLTGSPASAEGGSASGGDSQTQFAYDSFGNLTSTTNAKGYKVTTEYETGFYAYPKKITNALGHTISYVYDPKLGVVKQITDANRQTTTSFY